MAGCSAEQLGGSAVFDRSVLKCRPRFLCRPGTSAGFMVGSSVALSSLGVASQLLKAMLRDQRDYELHEDVHLMP